MTDGRWGVIGGLFDPVHYAHLAIAEQTAETLGLAGVLFVPAGRPVHRAGPVASAEQRVAMLELAVDGNDRFSVSRLEIDADRPSYSVDTLEDLATLMPAHSWVFIVSSEAAAYLPGWRRPDRLLDLAQLAIVPRLGYPDISPEWLEDHFPGRIGRFTVVETTRLGHSSSDIRQRLMAGRSIRYLVPDAVAAYIGDHRLYGSDDRSEA